MRSRWELAVIAALLTPKMVGQQPSAAEIIEHRVAEPPAGGTGQTHVGFEIAAPLASPSVLEARDGRWMMIGSGKMCFSRDAGKSWGAPESLSEPIDYAMRLQSGKLGGPAAVNASDVAQGKRGILYFYVSQDEGKTWQKRGRISVGDVPASPYPKTMIQLRAGRLVLPVRFPDGAGHMGLYNAAGAFGILNGKCTTPITKARPGSAAKAASWFGWITDMEACGRATNLVLLRRGTEI